MSLFRSAFAAIKKGLQKTAEAIGGQLRSLLLGRTLSNELIDEIESRLIAADVGVKAARELTAGLREEFRSGRVARGEDALEYLKASLKVRWPAQSRAIATAAAKPTVVLVVGVNGVGKTTSVAKIAKSLKDEGRSVLLAAADTFRAGAVAQLTEWSNRLGIDIVKGKAGADPAERGDRGGVVRDTCHQRVQHRQEPGEVTRGAGREVDDPGWAGDAASHLAVERLRYAARLAKASGLPVLITAGVPGPRIKMMACKRRAA